MGKIAFLYLIWFITFWGGATLLWISYSYSDESSNIILMFAGLITISLGSMFVGYKSGY